MSTLDREDLEVMKQQLINAKDMLISKEKVLSILHEKLKEVDIKNDFIVDRIDGAAIKELINSINKIQANINRY